MASIKLHAESPLFGPGSILSRLHEVYYWVSYGIEIDITPMTRGIRATQAGRRKAGLRLFQCPDPRCAKSVYWSWNGGREGSGAEALEKGPDHERRRHGRQLGFHLRERPERQVLNQDTASDLFKYSDRDPGEWPLPSAEVPCPTLKVIGAITAYQNKKGSKRMKQGLA